MVSLQCCDNNLKKRLNSLIKTKYGEVNMRMCQKLVLTLLTIFLSCGHAIAEIRGLPACYGAVRTFYNLIGDMDSYELLKEKELFFQQHYVESGNGSEIDWDNGVAIGTVSIATNGQSAPQEAKNDFDQCMPVIQTAINDMNS